MKLLITIILPNSCLLSEVIKKNVEAIRDHNINFMNPFLPLSNRKKLAEKLVEVFVDFGVNLKEVTKAVEAAFAEDRKFKQDIRDKGQEILKFLEETGTRGIVLAGRPYHVDPEIHHGIPKMINSLGLAVLTEDSVIEPGLLERPIRVVDQWAYHSRLYEAAAVTACHEELELVQLNSLLWP